MTDTTSAPLPAPRARRSIFLRRPFFTLALLVAAGYLACALFAPWIAPFDPVQQSIEAMMAPPGGAHLLGTDHLGRDMLSMVMIGARTSLVVRWSPS